MGTEHVMPKTWSEQILDLQIRIGDTSRIEHIQADGRDVAFIPAYGEAKGCAFTAWSRDYVYFPAQYDGMEWVDFVPRNPCAFSKNHVGGG